MGLIETTGTFKQVKVLKIRPFFWKFFFYYSEITVPILRFWEYSFEQPDFENVFYFTGHHLLLAEKKDRFWKVKFLNFDHILEI